MRTQKIRQWRVFAGTALFITALTPVAFGQGALTPSGAPAPTMKTLQQVEPRTDVLTLPADGLALHAIAQPGSYYLTTNILGVASGSICGIAIEADNVTLDLNGFALLGNGDFWSGLWVYGNRTNVTIINGTISGWGNAAVWADGGAQLRLERLQLNANKNPANAGVYAPNTSEWLIKNCQAQNNAGKGFWCNSDGTLDGCKSTGNGDDGMKGTTQCVIRNCEFFANGSNNISLGQSAIVEHCLVENAGRSGISVQDNSLIASCEVRSNSLTTYSAGILTTAGCTIKDCTLQGNYYGVNSGDNSSVFNCTATTTGYAYWMGNYCTVKDCAARLSRLAFTAGRVAVSSTAPSAAANRLALK